MAKSVKAKKKDKFKIFSIFAGIIFILIAVAKFVFNGGYVLATLWYESLLRYVAFDLRTILTLVSNLAGPLLFVGLALVAALILFIKKDSAAVFIPVGLLTYTIFGTIVATVTNIVLSRVVGESFQLIASLVSLSLSVVLAIIVTALLFIAAVTFLKKHRYVLMFILLAAFIIGTLLSLSATILSWGSNVQYYQAVFEYFKGLDLIFIAVRLFVLPVVGLIINCGLCLAVLLAAIGMIGGKKKADIIEGIEEAEITEAKN